MTARALIPPGKRYRLLRRPPDSIRPASPRPARRDCHGRLLAALLGSAGGACRIEDSHMVPWASATFVGARHEVVLALSGEDAGLRAELLGAMLPEKEFRIPGHVVADVVVDRREIEGQEARLMLSVLTIESW